MPVIRNADAFDEPFAGTDWAPLPSGPLCGRCYAEGVELFPANCAEKPEAKSNAALGMYHCPDCGAMIVAGLPHPPMCMACVNRTHPRFDL